MLQKWFIIAIVVALGLSVLVYGIVERGSIEPGDWVQIFILLALVAVTGAYAWSASKQADASVKMAKEMREQTKTQRETISISIRPLILFGIIQIKEDNSYPFAPPRELIFTLQNTGKGPARNLVVTCEGQGKKVEYSKIELPSLNVGDKEKYSISRKTTISDGEIRVAYVLLMAEYNDELGEIWRATLEIDKNDTWRLGEISPPERLFGGET